MWISSFKESQRLKQLVAENPTNLDYHLEQARFFAGRDDDINTIISYCKIIKFFDNNLTAYIELSEYLYFSSRNDWALIVAEEGLKYHNSQKLKEILKNSYESIIAF